MKQHYQSYSQIYQYFIVWIECRENITPNPQLSLVRVQPASFKMIQPEFINSLNVTVNEAYRLLCVKKSPDNSLYTSKIVKNRLYLKCEMILSATGMNGISNVSHIIFPPFTA